MAQKERELLQNGHTPSAFASETKNQDTTVIILSESLKVIALFALAMFISLVIFKVIKV